MNIKELAKEFKALLKEEVSLEQISTADGTVFEAEAFDEGEMVFVISDDNRVAVPDGSYELEDGRTITVAEGVIVSIATGEAEEEEPESEEEELGKDTPMTEEMVRSMIAEMFAQLLDEANKQEMAAEAKQEPKKEEVEASKQEPKKEEVVLEAEPLKGQPSKGEEVKKHLFSQKRAKSTKDSVYSKIANIKRK